MKLQIKNEPVAGPKLYLTYSGSDVVVMAEDSGGDDWSLLRFNSDGTLTREGGVPTELGFGLDSEERILLADY